MRVESRGIVTGEEARNEWRAAEAPVDDAPNADDEVFESDDDYRAFAPRPRLMSPLTWMLLFALTASAGFLVGAKLQHRSAAQSTSSTSGTAASFAAAAAARGFGGGAGTGASSATSSRAGAATSAPAASGTVKLVDGQNVYVADAQGNIVKVTVGPGTKVVVTRPATLTDLTVGQTVTVEGTAGADGTLQATLLTGVASTAPSSGP